MGQVSSTTNGGTKVFAPLADPRLQAKLDAVTESDVVRRLRHECAVEAQVAERLKAQVAQADAQLEHALEAARDVHPLAVAEDTSAALREQVAKLQHALDARPRRAAPSAAAEKAKTALVECLKTQRDRPLDCRRELAEFAKAVAE